MKRSTIWGLALTLVLGCWVGSASARPLTATDSLLVPYYEARGNLSTQIAVQHVGPQDGVSIINVAVHDADGGIAAGGYICLGPNEFGYVVLQNAQPPLDQDFGIYFSAARDAIDSTGFVGLAYAGERNSCSDGAGTTQATARTSDFAMVAWAVLQDVGSGFFATEIPVVQVGWEAPQSAGSPAKGLEPYCRSNVTRARVYDQFTDTTNTACNANYTFVASGPYCYANDPDDDAATPPTRARVDAQLNDAGTGCNDEFTHTFVPANTRLPAIPALGPRADISDGNACGTAATGCPGLAFNTADTDDTIGARFDVESFNRSVSNVYLWLDTAPLDGREATVSAICEDGMAKESEITIDDHVTVINPANMGCSGRGVLELTLPERDATDPDDGCYVSNDPLKALVTSDEATAALDDLNNKCRSFSFTSDISRDGTATSDPGCYDRGISYVFTNDINNDGTTDDPGCYDRNAFPRPTSSTAAVEIGSPPTSCHPRPISSVTAVQIETNGAVTGCKSYTYAKAVTADSPSGYIFSHISQADAHFRMNFPGYVK